MKQKTVYALGFFDGVHLGHQALLASCKALASSLSCKAGAVTFVSHPDALVHGAAPKLLGTVESRCGLLRDYGMDSILQLPFDEALKTMPWQSFLEMLVQQGACGFVCGEDFRFGHRGEGTAQLLKAACLEQGLPCVVVSEQTVDGVRISSTYIRGFIETGRMEDAVRFLGHPHVLTGTVVRGKQLGRTIGIPTANLHLPEGVVCPRFGVYACKAIVEGDEYLAVTNVGIRPTVSGEGVTIEPWLLDFEGDLYGKPMTLHFYSFLRPEKKFDSLEALRQEIQKNAQETREFFEKERK